MYIIPQIPKIRNDLAAGSLGMREIPSGEQKPLDAKTETGPNDHPELTNIPPSLSSIQCLGAFKRFKCFFGPRTILLPDPVKHTHSNNNLPQLARGRTFCGTSLCVYSLSPSMQQTWVELQLQNVLRQRRQAAKPSLYLFA